MVILGFTFRFEILDMFVFETLDVFRVGILDVFYSRSFGNMKNSGKKKF
jgi:hypothetical protein